MIDREEEILSSSHQIYWADKTGDKHAIGTLSFESDGSATFDASNYRLTVKNDLPWFLAHLKPEGFIGRIHANHISHIFGYDKNPEKWNLREIFCSSVYLSNPSGAITIGNSLVFPPSVPSVDFLISPDKKTDRAAFLNCLDDCAIDVARALPFGSSAGGEQPKFMIAVPEHGELTECIVKFSPPVGTPFGDRWHDLLIAELSCAISVR